MAGAIDNATIMSAADLMAQQQSKRAGCCRRHRRCPPLLGSPETFAAVLVQAGQGRLQAASAYSSHHVAAAALTCRMGAARSPVTARACPPPLLPLRSGAYRVQPAPFAH